MDSTAGDLSHAAHEIEGNLEKRPSHSTDGTRVDRFEEAVNSQSHSSGSSSEDVAHLEKLDSRIVRVPEVKEGEEAYAHLPEHEKEIVKRQLDTPEVKVTYRTLYRYATRNDLIIVAISALMSIAGGTVMPLMTVRTPSTRGRAFFG